MERRWLERELGAGRSIESIAREAGKHPSTVGYWVDKHGLTSTFAARFAAKGGVDRQRLLELVEAGMTLQQMSAELGLGSAAVRHWMRRYGLKTARARRRAERVADERQILRECVRHGYTLFVRSGRGGRVRCRLCRVEAVSARRRRVKQALIEEAGGCCRLCGYDRLPRALAFHHVDPATKSFGLATQGIARSLEKAREEVRKCVLLCANCHAEVEDGVASIPR